MDYDYAHVDIEDIYSHAKSHKLATFAVLHQGQPKYNIIRESDSSENEFLDHVDSDDTLIEVVTVEDAKLQNPPCYFDPTQERCPKSTILIFNTSAPPEFKAQDLADLSKEKTAPQSKKPLDYIRLNKQLIKHMMKKYKATKLSTGAKSPSALTPGGTPAIPTTRSENTKITPATSTSPSLQIKRDGNLKSNSEPQKNVASASESSPKPASVPHATPAPVTAGRQVVRPVTISSPPQKSQPQLTLSARQHAALVDRCVKQAIRTKVPPLRPSLQTPDCRSAVRYTATTTTASPKATPPVLMSPKARYCTKEEVEVVEKPLAEDSGSATIQDTSSESGRERPPPLPSKDRLVITQYLLQEHESQRKKIQYQRRRRQKRVKPLVPPRRALNNSSSMSLNISSTCSDESSLEYTDEEFPYVPHK